jgi:hypothetical protein
MAVTRFSSITFTGIKAEIERYLSTEFGKAGILYSPASPYGQILSVLENLHQLSLLYLKNAITQLDLSTPNAINPRVIKSAAIYAGHNPGRGISATGTLRFSLKSSTDIDKDIPGGRITINNKILMKNNTNSLDYSVNLGIEKVTHKITPNYSFYLNIIQGKWNARTFTSTGSPLQTFAISETGSKDVENFNIEVYVNGVMWSLKKHIYEMLPDEEACVVRTGFNGGIDIIFGNGGFGAIPVLAAPIAVRYLTTDGSAGNIFRRTRDDFKFIDDIVDGNGETVDITRAFNVDIVTDINFGADPESLLFTKSILPIASNNFVLGTPQQYAYEIKKLGVFSHVNAYERTGTIFIVATPNVRLFKNQNANYFTISLRAFELDQYEIGKINKYLKTSGTLQLTRKYKIQSPKLSYYVMNVFVMSYSDATDESVKAQILDKISEYFLSLKRMDRIPKLDLIKELSSISDIHSVDIQFICKKNEDYHRQNLAREQISTNISATKFGRPIAARPNPNYDRNRVIGIDPVLGDILFEPDEIPIIRGGWRDRNKIYYATELDGNQMKSVNIIKQGVIDSKKRTTEK